MGSERYQVLELIGRGGTRLRLFEAGSFAATLKAFSCDLRSYQSIDWPSVL